MVAGYVHVEIEVAQSSKRPAAPCGDVVEWDRTVAATTLVCADGIGSGIRARIAAQMCAGRIKELLRLGFSLRKAFAAVAHTMQAARDPARPFAAFAAARILNDGMATVLGYEMPAPLLVSRRQAVVLPQTVSEMGGALVQESNCYLEPGDALLLTSDGITQAGIGGRSPQGWESQGVARHLSSRLTEGLTPQEIPTEVLREARRLWVRGGDDCTVAMALCRRGQVVNVLTGPSASRSSDAQAVSRFMQSQGLKIVCGGTTAEIVARVLRQRVEVEKSPTSLIAPPRYEIQGVDLVTEGAVTLNQAYNVLDEDIRNLKEDSGVTELCALLQIADRVNIFLGGAQNSATGDISFRQRGILSRRQIIPLLAEKLREAGKLVVIETV
jgi:hypothetical protein